MNQPDPVFDGALTNPQRWNRYAYVGNNPLTMNDPSGMKPEDKSGHFFAQDDQTYATGGGDFGPGYSPLDASGGLMGVPTWTDDYRASEAEAQQRAATTPNVSTPRPSVEATIVVTLPDGSQSIPDDATATQQSDLTVGAGYNFGAMLLLGRTHSTEWLFDVDGEFEMKTKSNAVTAGVVTVNAGAGFQGSVYWKKDAIVGDYASLEISAGFLLPALPSITFNFKPNGGALYGVSVSVGKSILPQISFGRGSTAACSPGGLVSCK
jgi:hypothetical protein